MYRRETAFHGQLNIDLVLAEARVDRSGMTAQYPRVTVGYVVSILTVYGHADALVQVARAEKLIVIDIGAIVDTARV